MNLQPINPPLKNNHGVYCVKCSARCGSRLNGTVNVVQAWADLDAAPGTIYCQDCAHIASADPDAQHAARYDADIAAQQNAENI